VKQRSGFTLIEVLVAIVLTSVVSLLVYGAAQAARDTKARVEAERSSLQRALAMRLLLADALAGAQTTLRALDTVFLLDNRIDNRGIPQDRLTFVASGDFPPLSPGVDWTVTLEATSTGLLLSGRPRGLRARARRLALLPGVRGLEIRTKQTGKDVSWSSDWKYPTALPMAVQLTYWAESGPVGVPLTVRLALGQVDDPRRLIFD
jgi:prepilin-type N-terminal cleavage/methylation domain-containing protein